MTRRRTGACSPRRAALHVAVAGVVPSAPERAYRLYLQEIPDGEPRPFGPEDVGLFEWSSPVSPDGRLIILKMHGRAVLCPIGGREATTIPGLAEGDRPIQWSADGHAVYVTRLGESQVWLVDVTTGQKRLWRQIRPEDPFFFRLRITPDGGAYVYTTDRFLSELYVVEGLH